MPLSPAVLEVAHKLLLLGVHRDHRLTGRQRCLDLGIDDGELRIPIRVAYPLAGFGVGLQAEAEPVQQLAHQRAADLMALGLKLVGKPAQALAGQRSGPSGSPRAVGSTRAFRSRIRSGSAATAGLRPPPAPRTRPAARAGASASSRSPRPMVLVATPVARHTAAMPPYPAALASAATSNRRPRSSKIEDSAA